MQADAETVYLNAQRDVMNRHISRANVHADLGHVPPDFHVSMVKIIEESAQVDRAMHVLACEIKVAF